MKKSLLLVGILGLSIGFAHASKKDWNAAIDESGDGMPGAEMSKSADAAKKTTPKPKSKPEKHITTPSKPVTTRQMPGTHGGDPEAQHRQEWNKAIDISDDPSIGQSQ